jgi:membrane-associated phospholipid phosphatase
MTIFLIISTVYPNGHYLRPYVFERDNIFTRLCAFLYNTDTATNLFPSIHVYNSVGVHLAVVKSERFGNDKKAKTISFLLMFSIILSTMFIKQHSTFDVLTALLLCAVMYRVVYVHDSARLSQRASKSTGRYRKGLPQS